MSGAALGDKIRRLIAAGGPLSVADYMATCLGDPRHGYYMTRQPIGSKGDFVTAPEVSQMFGEIVGAWLIHAWRLAGAPPARLVELGPGRGTLLADILRVARSNQVNDQVMTTHLVETSPNLRAEQAMVVSNKWASWHASFAEAPKGPILLVANEFFDALPIRQYVKAAGLWRERVVGLGPDGALCFGLGAGGLADGPDAPDGATIEIGPAREALAADIARRIVAEGGAALIIDYGHDGGLGDTLQAVRRHAFADPLDAPGESDLSAHVDFSALARAATAEGAAVHGPMPQGDFLLALGLLERAGQLGAGGDDAARAALRCAVDRLAGPAAMGTLFKALAITRPGIRPPPFDVAPA